MDIQHPQPIFTQYLYALILASTLVLLIAVRTNMIPPQWDASYYVDMAKSGIFNNPNLVAPYAYRPGMPFISGLLSTRLSMPVETGFKITGYFACVAFLIGVFTLSRCFAATYRHALTTMILLGFSFVHVKVALFFPTLVDVAAYPIMVLAFWALFTKRLTTCLLLCSIGLLFKEFLAVPLILLFIRLGRTALDTRSQRDIIRFVAAICIGAASILIPRLFIPVGATQQFVDPLNDPSTLSQLINAPLDEFRMFNILYANISYWLPTLLLMTKQRFALVWDELQNRDLLLPCVIGLLLIFLLTLYGGTNIATFTAYAVAIQTVVLTLVFRIGAGTIEIMYVMFVLLIYNKILLHIPTPDANFDAYIDFYGGWSSRVSLTTLMRLLECCAFIGGSMLIRMITARINRRLSIG